MADEKSGPVPGNALSPLLVQLFIKPSKVMKTQETLKKCLARTGIQPSYFAFFLMEFRKKHKPGKSQLSKHLVATLKAQAELIGII